MPNHPVPALALTDGQRDMLTTWSRSRALPQRQVLRARIVLLAAEGVSNTSIAARLGCSDPTVRLWRARFAAAGIAGLEEDAPGRGRPATYDERMVAKVISTTLGTPPRGETHWSCRAVAESVGVSRSTVLRIWQEHELQPHRTRSFKASTDPELEAKVTDVVGLYLHPPEKAAAVLRSRRWIERNRCCQCDRVSRNGALTTMFAMGRPPCSRRSTLPPAKSPDAHMRAIGTRSS